MSETPPAGDARSGGPPGPAGVMALLETLGQTAEAKTALERARRLEGQESRGKKP